MERKGSHCIPVRGKPAIADECSEGMEKTTGMCKMAARGWIYQSQPCGVR
jgi:hypothetical protein